MGPIILFLGMLATAAVVAVAYWLSPDKSEDTDMTAAAGLGTAIGGGVEAAAATAEHTVGNE